MNYNIYILYGSQTGNAEEISKYIYKLLSDKGYKCNYSSLNKTIENNNFTFLNNKEKTTLIIVCSTTGNGDPPESAYSFWIKLKNRNNSKNLLSNIQFAVLALGDTNYDKFCQFGKNLDSKFHELGGKRFIDLHCADEVVDQEKTVELFIEKAIVYVDELFSSNI